MASASRRMRQGEAWPLAALFILVFAAGWPSGALVRSAHAKDCPPGCTTFGTCYKPLGRRAAASGALWQWQCAGDRNTERFLGGRPRACPWRCRCDCPWNRTGADCSKHFQGFCLSRADVDTCGDDHPALCLNGCQGRGKCMGGFCHCQPGASPAASAVLLWVPRLGLGGRSPRARQRGGSGRPGRT